ncbi:11512_t:CDS:2, partial [Ambispora gerdemannii]
LPVTFPDNSATATSTLTLPSPPSNPSNNLISLHSKIIYIHPIDSISNEEIIRFRFVSSDTKENIKEEISKAFNLERFSLRDDKRNIVTGSWDSLENNRHYEIIDRGELTKISRKGKKHLDFNSKYIINEPEYAEEFLSESHGESEERDFDGRITNNKRSTTREDGRKKRKKQSHLIRKTSESRKMSIKRASFTPENEISANYDAFENDDSRNTNNDTSGDSIGGQVSKRPVSHLGSSKSGKTQVKACSRCRKGKKGCDRNRPCARCVRADMEASCDAGEPIIPE